MTAVLVVIALYAALAAMALSFAGPANNSRRSANRVGAAARREQQRVQRTRAAAEAQILQLADDAFRQMDDVSRGGQS